MMRSGEIELRAEAQRLYDSGLRERLFEEAYERFPDCNFDEGQADLALGHVLGGFERECADNYAPAAWPVISDEIGEAIPAGLA